MEKQSVSEGKSFRAGMYLLDSFTSGMYNDPLIIYREYIQNAVDSIDMSLDQKSEPFEVKIQLEPGTRKITIHDNAMGLHSAMAEEVFSSVGSSSKTFGKLRGFRGIGRLGGIAFSDQAVFRTKAKNEAVESIQEWDCQHLRRLLAEQRKDTLTLEEVFHRVTRFRQEKCQNSQDSYFEVILSGVNSFRNQIFDLDRVQRYLRQTAPLPFDSAVFSFAEKIDEYLSKALSSYCRYNIFLNGEQIHKPYRDSVRITKGNLDQIDGINFFKIEKGKDRPMAYGWYGRRRELLGAITRGDDLSGIRVRVGNIQIGDAHLLDLCFREPRFNGYVIGEIHVESMLLIPNSRRDDFVDNTDKGAFYNAIEKEVGLPISKEIRYRSRLASTHPVVAIAPGEKKEPFMRASAEKTMPKPDDGVLLKLNDVPSALQDMCQDCPNLSKLRALLNQRGS